MDVDIDEVVVPKEPERPPPSSSTPRSVARRGVRWLCIACTVIGILTTTIVVAAACWFAFSVAQAGLQSVTDPHSKVFGVSTDVLNPANVVQPLIDTNTTFDVAFCVAYRVPNAQSEHPDWYDEAWDGGEWADNAEAKTIASTTNWPLVEVVFQPTERPLFCKEVIKGFSLASKDQEVTVDFELPLQRFYDTRLYSNDVWGTVFINPSPSSRISHVTNYSDTMPDTIHRHRELFSGISPFRFDDGSAKSSVLRSLGVSFPLISLDDGEASEEDAGEQTSGGNDSQPNLNTTDLSAPAIRKLRPYLRTRAHAYVLNETRPINRFEFDSRHSERKQKACTNSTPGMPSNPNPLRSAILCNTEYPITGHWEFAYELGTDAYKVPLAYHPYIRAIPNAASPKHLMPLPVNLSDTSDHRGMAWDAESGDYISQSVNASVTLQFSVFKPRHTMLLQGLPDHHQGIGNMSQRVIAQQHDDYEQIYGLFHAPRRNSHPWRRLILSTIMLPLAICSSLLSILYWWTRVTTTGLSHVGLVFSLLDVVLQPVLAFRERLWFVMVPVLVESTPVAYSKLRLLLPIGPQKTNRGWVIRYRRPTHRERASQRLDISWTTGAVVFVSFLALHMICVRYTIYITHPTIPLEQSAEPSAWSKILDSMWNAATLSSGLIQIIFNNRSGTFAGDYRLTAYLKVAFKVGHTISESQYVIGEYELGEGSTPTSVASTLIEAALAWQAFKLPRVEQHIKDPEEE